MSNARKIKRTLKNEIKKISTRTDVYCKSASDFTRNRKLSFRNTMKAILCLGGKSLSNELIEFFDCNENMPSTSAFVQQRAKIKPSAFEKLFHEFTNLCNKTNLFKGYQLIAVDGSDVNVPKNSNDLDSLHYNQTDTTFNLYHLNALYDLGSNVYLDAIVQKYRFSNEHKAFIDMVDRFNSEYPAIFIADRGYESFNNMAHVQKSGNKFLFRIKDFQKNGILCGLDVIPDNSGCFDMDFDLNLTRRQTNEVKSLLLNNRNHYKYINTNVNFDFLPKTYHKHDPLLFFNLKFRLVRIEIENGKFEVIATNLDKNDFPPCILKQLYSMRWGIETSFRQLKYTIGLLHFHSKKSEHILQEIFAGLTMYNFTQFVVSTISVKNVKRKHSYKINFSVATHNCRNFFLERYTLPKIETSIIRHILPIRNDCHKPRHLRSTSAISFIYRVA